MIQDEENKINLVEWKVSASDEDVKRVEQVLRDIGRNVSIKNYTKPELQGRCKDCQYWKPVEKWIGLFDTGYCGSPKLMEPFTEEAWEVCPIDGATAGRGGSLLTGKEFGCVNWKAKPQNLNHLR